MIQRFITTPPELVALGGSQVFSVGIRAEKIAVYSDFPLIVDANGIPLSNAAIAPRFKTTLPFPPQFIRVSLPTGWSTVAQVARRHGWVLIEVGTKDEELVFDGNPVGLPMFEYNFHITLTASDVDALTQDATAYQRNGRLPDICYLNAVSIYTHDSGQELPEVFDVMKVQFNKLPVNPAGVPEDATIAFDVPVVSGVQGRSWWSAASPMKLPLRSLFASYGAGDTTPMLQLAAWHANPPPATTDATITLHCSGLMV